VIHEGSFYFSLFGIFLYIINNTQKNIKFKKLMSIYRKCGKIINKKLLLSDY